MNEGDLEPLESLPTDSREALKRHAYRRWWSSRRELTEKKWRVGSKMKFITKSERFRQIWGESLEEYHSRLRAYTLEHSDEGQHGKDETADTRRGT